MGQLGFNINEEDKLMDNRLRKVITVMGSVLIVLLFIYVRPISLEEVKNYQTTEKVKNQNEIVADTIPESGVRVWVDPYPWDDHEANHKSNIAINKTIGSGEKILNGMGQIAVYVLPPGILFFIISICAMSFFIHGENFFCGSKTPKDEGPNSNSIVLLFPIAGFFCLIFWTIQLWYLF